MRTHLKTLQRTLSMLALTLASFASPGAAPAHALIQNLLFNNTNLGGGSQDLILNGGQYVFSSIFTGIVVDFGYHGQFNNTFNSDGQYGNDAGYVRYGYDVGYISYVAPGVQYVQGDRNYFAFDLAGVTTPITSATMSLSNPTGGFTGNLNNYSVHDITPFLNDVFRDGGGALYDAIGAAPVIGSTHVDATSNGTNVNINLNPYELAVLNANEYVAIGGTLSAVPLPAGLPMFAFAVLAMFAAVQFRNQRKLA
jgi:hypothetical protein